MSFSEKHLLLIGTGGPKRRRVLERLRALGLGRLTILHDQPNWAASYCDEWIAADSSRPSQQTVDTVRARIGRPDGVLTYDDYSVRVAAHLAQAFDLVGIPLLAAAQSKDKGAFRRLCVERGLPAPKFVQVEAADPAIDRLLAQRGMSFPVVVKPAHGGGSVLVRRANDSAELASVLQAYQRSVLLEPAAALWPDHTVVIEEYLVGAEVDIDMLVQGGKLHYAAVTDNFAPLEPYFMELGGQIPSALPQAAQAELVRVAFEVVAALGAGDCCVHFEARWTARGAVPIEANLRVGGAEVYSFNLEARGVDLVEGAARIALGLPLPAVPPVDPGVFLRSANLIPPGSGALSAMGVDPWLRKDPALAELVLFREEGDRLRVPPDGFDYLGWLVARGTTRHDANDQMHRLVDGLHFEVGGTAFNGAFLGELES